MTESAGLMIVNQFLHGYAQGHMLLEGSCSLPAALQRTLLVQSDLYGGSLPEGFDGYLAGYPLPDGKTYALARTWYAAEMPRPGCVWTHTLLIRRDDLCKVRNAQVFLPCFRRPTAANWRGTYARPLQVDHAEHLVRKKWTLKEHRVAVSLVAAVYSEPYGPVFLPGDSSAEHEDLVLRLWGQQWESLKMAFSFCTSSVTVRRLGKLAFDVQVVPRSNSRHIHKDLRNAGLMAVKTTEVELWTRVAGKDLAIGRNGRFHRFLRKYGNELGCERKALRLLAEIFAFVFTKRRRAGRFNDVVDFVCSKLPAVDQGIPLKRDVFGISGVLHESETEILRGILTATKAESLSASDLNLFERANNLAREDSSAASSLLNAATETPDDVQGEVIAGLVAGLSSGALASVVRRKPQLIPLVLGAKPILAADPSLWAGSPAEQMERWAIVKTMLGRVPAPREACVEAMMNAGADSLAYAVHSYLGEDAIDLILAAMNRQYSDSSSIPTGWKTVLRSSPRRVLAAIAGMPVPKISTVAAAVESLDPGDSSVLHAGSQIWIRALEDLKSHSASDQLKVAAFGLCIAFQNPDSASPALAVRAFPIVHSAVWNSRLAECDWDRIKRFVPNGSGWKDWDRCERLRHGLRRAFKSFHWPPSHLVDLAQDVNAFVEVVQTFQGKWSGRRILDQLRAIVLEGRHQCIPDAAMNMLFAGVQAEEEEEFID